mgnify:CR=1 FL=1
MIQIFLAAIIFLSTPAENLSTPLPKDGYEFISYQQTHLPSVLLFQPESMEAGDESALKPFEGFSIISVAGILLTVALVVFVVFKVMRGMNRKEESATEE